MARNTIAYVGVIQMFWDKVVNWWKNQRGEYVPVDELGIMHGYHPKDCKTCIHSNYYILHDIYSYFCKKQANRAKINFLCSERTTSKVSCLFKLKPLQFLLN